MTSGTRVSGRPGLSPEEFGYLSGGSRRAAEVAIVRLLEGRLLRISREGVVSTVAASSWTTTTPLEAYALGAAQTGRPLGALIKSTACSDAAAQLHTHLVATGMLVSESRRRLCTTIRWLALLAIVGLVLGMSLAHFRIDLGVGAIVVLLIVRFIAGRLRRTVRRAGRRAVRGVRVSAADRVGMVAEHGLLGKPGRRPVWEMLGIPTTAGATLVPGKRSRSTDSGSGCGSGCSSCSSSSGCGTSSCSSSGGDSGGSSCGGGGCGGGGGD
jgi:uncharacterized protein (TIGR04222 family)